MSTLPTIGRDDLERSIAADRLDKLLGEPIERDDPEREAKLATRLAWALEIGVAELSLYIDLKAHATLSVLYREYAVQFALYHLERTTRAGASKPSRDDFDLSHKNLAMAHRGERLPGERDQRSTVTAVVIEDESPWSRAKMHGFE